MYRLGVILIDLGVARMEVRKRSWVARVAKKRCHDVRRIAVQLLWFSTFRPGMGKEPTVACLDVSTECCLRGDSVGVREEEGDKGEMR
jgi:hypothetical protein